MDEEPCDEQQQHHHQHRQQDEEQQQAHSIRTSFDNHYGRMLDEKSVKLIKEFHEQPKLKTNISISQIKLPKLGSLSVLKPMIDENKESVIRRFNASDCHEFEKYFPKDKYRLNDFQMELYSLLNSYKDLIYTNESHESLEELQKVYLLHVMTHLFNSRSAIISNNKVFEKKTLSDNIIHDDPKLRDQGFTRARILILLPFRQSALRVGKNIVKLLGDKFNINNMDRFIQEFGDDGEDTTLRPIPSDGNKPADFYHTFHGNTDDAFRIGLKLTKRSLKFFADFYDSDIIIASPLGLKTLLTPEESQACSVAAGASSAASSDMNELIPANGDKDFLSSIEMILLDQGDVFLMQNWEHVIDIMQHINLMPSKPRTMDISRVRSWYLEDWSKYYRQLIVFTSISVPLLHSFFQTHSFNYEGYLTFKHRIENPQVKQLTSKCKQQFLYFDSPNAKESCDDRFNFFTKTVLPKYYAPNGGGSGRTTTVYSNNNYDGDGQSSTSNTHNHTNNNNNSLDHTLILVSSYFDFVRLRNYFRREKLSFTQICEYTEENKVSKARQLFYFGARQFLLYSERCHFFNRYKIKGIRNIIFYEPPLFTKYYTELVNMMTPELQGKKFANESMPFDATTLFSNHDTLQLGAIIGYSNAVKLIQTKKSIN